MIVTFLEHKIPPPLVLLIALALMRIIALFDSTSMLTNAASPWLAFGLMMIGLLLAVLGVASFNKSQTTVNPLQPDQASSLVTTGVFKLTRNPMYLGMAFVSLAWMIYLESAWSGLGVILFILFITRFQIIPEERVMREKFGQQFERYVQRTRRWL